MTRIFGFIAFVLGLFVCFGFGFAWTDIKSRRKVSLDTFSRITTPPAATVTPERVFKDAYENVLESYYRPVKSKNLTYAGISGMMSSLGDPHTIFLPPVAAKEFDVDTQGRFVGIGARLDSDVLGAKIVSVFDEGPAAAAGLKAGDLIVQVDGKSMAGVSVTNIVSKIRGQEGTNVKLTIRRGTDPKPIVVSIKRARVNTPTVELSFLKDDNVALMTIHQFAEPTTSQFDHALDQIEARSVKGLVIDLRDNPGGLLESDVEMLSRFISGKVVVRIKSRDGIEEQPKTYDNLVRKFPYPVVILMNEDTASAAEIFSGVLRDYKLATLVGVHSYGKASVQNIFHLRDGSSAKITIGRYFLPLGSDIGRKLDEDGQFISGGLEPDVRAEIDPDDIGVELGSPTKDAQLAKALEVIRSRH